MRLHYHENIDTHSPSPYRHLNAYPKQVKNYKEILAKFGKRVRNLRAEKGISSQDALGLKCGMDRTYIGGIERGERNLSLESIEKISIALNVSLEELFRL